jgi:glutathione S-transferase
VTGPPLTLFLDAFFCSPFDFRCFVALEEKGLEFGVTRVMVRESQGLTPVYKERSITARVPGIAHGDFWLAESQAIVEYLEETFPPPGWPPLLPAAPRARARGRQLMSFFSSDLYGLIRERPSWMVTYPVSPPPLSPVARAEADELLHLASAVLADDTLGPWTIAHADLTFFLLRLVRTGETLPPEIQALVDTNLARPSVRKYLEHERPPNPPQTGRRAAT